eukprot:5170839-Prymnesium_polylepis.1
MKPKAGKSKGVDSRSTMLQELTHTLKKKKEVRALRRRLAWSGWPSPSVPPLVFLMRLRQEEEAMVRELTRAESGPHGVLLEELRAVKAAQADSVGAVQQAIRELKAEQAAWQEQHAERIEGALLRAIGLLEAHASAAAASEPPRARASSAATTTVAGDAGGADASSAPSGDTARGGAEAMQPAAAAPAADSGDLRHSPP